MCSTKYFVKFRRSIEEFMETQQNGCSVEKCAFICALVNCVITGSASIVSTFWLLGHVFWYFLLGYSHAGTLVTDLLVTAIAGGTMVIAFASFGFGVVLVRGILLRSPVLLRVYLIFSCLVVSTCLASAISLAASSRGFDLYVSCALIITGITAIYSIIISIIWRTYVKFHNARQFEQHQHINQIPTSAL